MTGVVEWTYHVGDFENGTGEWTEANIPWWGSDLSLLDILVEPGAIEFTLPGKFHDLGFDMTLRLLQPLSPGVPSDLDPTLSMFEIQVGVSHSGHVVSGRLVPMMDVCVADLDGDGVVSGADLAVLLGFWGECAACAPDLNGDDVVNGADLALLLGAWGVCP